MYEFIIRIEKILFYACAYDPYSLFIRMRTPFPVFNFSFSCILLGMRGITPAMSEIRFYHLTRGKPEDALAILLEKACERDMTCFVLCDDKAQMKFLDQHLWSYKADSFLPHGTQDENARREDHPIILGYDPESLESADFLVLYGIEMPKDISGYDLVADIFDDNDEQGKKAARKRWKELQESDHVLTYWQQEENGSWQKKS